MTLIATDIDYDNLLNMLNSEDQENKVMAFQCIENSAVVENIVCLMLLRLEGKASWEDWRSNAPEAARSFKTLGLDKSTPLDFKDILQAMKRINDDTTGNFSPISRDQIDLYIEKMNVFIKSKLNECGFTSVKEIKTTVRHG